MEKTVLQFRISLDGTDPEIWRTFLVDDSITLHKLHEIIQVVMGWENAHLYSFTINKSTYEPPNPDGEDDFSIFGFGTPPVNSKKTRLSELNLRSRKKFMYTYDFGDNWDHTLLVEKVINDEKKLKTPVCLDGKRNCPPEDCGSVFGYGNIIDALKKKKKSKDDLRLLEWLGDDYDPDSFNVEIVNSLLQPVTSKRPKLKLIQGGRKDFM
jgi:hypothetical protein